MSVFPILIDSRPEYAARHASLSLLQLPLCEGTVLTYLGERLRRITPRAPLVVRAVGVNGGDYDQELLRSGVVREPSVSADSFHTCISRFEPSDWLLFIDPRCFSVDGFDPSPLVGNLGDAPRIARHLVALEASTTGTSERVEFDAEKRVRRVQRYYDAVTWTVVKGVACSMVPVSSLTVAENVRFDSLTTLRRTLAANVVPSRDIPMAATVLDLSTERGLLALNDRMLLADEAAAPQESARVASGVRLVGRVVLQPGSVVERGATIIGPAVIGRDARVESGATVAQCVIAPNTVVVGSELLRHRVVTGVIEGPPADAGLEETGSTQLTLFEEARKQRLYPTVKLVLEASCAIALLILLSPVMLLVAILVKLESKGPILYGDPREAKGGRLFHCYKFRTMRVGADAAQRELAAANQVDGPQFKMASDPRVTRVGRWLRPTSLDELPQLFNVAMGQMSLVGPRPSPFRENQTCVPWRDARLSVRPGITGMWQVCRHNREEGDFHQWIYYDIQYIRHMSFLVDLKILAATVWTLGGKGHVPFSWIVSSASKEHA